MILNSFHYEQQMGSTWKIETKKDGQSVRPIFGSGDSIEPQSLVNQSSSNQACHDKIICRRVDNRIQLMWRDFLVKKKKKMLPNVPLSWRISLQLTEVENKINLSHSYVIFKVLLPCVLGLQ